MDTGTHLSGEAVEALKLCEVDRIQYVRTLTSEAWIPYPQAKTILRELRALIALPRSHRMPNLLVWGDTNNGKTRILKKLYAEYEKDVNPTGEAVRAPVAKVEVQSPSLSMFYNDLLRSFSALFREGDRVEVKQFQAMKLLRTAGTRLLLIDEINTAIAGSLTKQREFMNTLKYLGNQLELPIAGFGTKEALSALKTCRQMNNRFKRIELKRWQLNDDFFQLLASFESIIPLQEPSDLQETVLARRLHAMSEGYIGELAALLTEAAVQAIRNKSERITVKLIDKLGWEGPTQRER